MDYSKVSNDTISSIEPEMISSFSKQISGISDVILLTVGEPDLNTPEHIKEAAKRAIDNNDSHYGDPAGLLKLRQAAASYLNNKYNLKYDPEDQIVITNGVSEGLVDTFESITNPGDEVIVPTPTFPVYESVIKIAGADPIDLNMEPDDFKLTPEKLEETINDHPKTKALLLNYPSNPGGITYSCDELNTIADIAQKYGIMIVSDEVYSEITYENQHISMGTILPNQTIVLNGLSKSHAMTGWRVGLICGPVKLMKLITNAHLYNSYVISSISQRAGIEAFENGYDDPIDMCKTYKKRRDIVIDGLSKMGIDCPTPTGAFYILAKMPEGFGDDSYQFCLRLAKEAHVGVVPGVGFGPGGEGYFRISYAANTELIKTAMKRMQTFVNENAELS